METKEIYRYPYNVRPEDEIKVFLSDVICEQVVKVNYRNGQFFCTIKDKITSNNMVIILSAGIFFDVLFSMALDARVNGKLEFNLLENNNKQVIMAKNNSSSPTIVPGLAKGFSSHSRVNRPAGARGLKPGRVTPSPALKAPRGLITSRPQTGAGARREQTSLNGAGNPGGGASFDDQCPVSKEQKSKEPVTHHHDFTQKSKKKKKRNQHLNRQIDVNGEKFEFEWDQIEKKTPSHGPEFGLEPDYGPDGKIIRDRKTGKPRAKQNKENYEKFADNLDGFAKDPKSERIEPQYRKGRENEQDAVGFLNRKDKRFIIFDRHTKKYITGWVMNDLQYQEFIENNNII